MILLDTHVLVWLVLSPKKLSKAASSAIRRAEMANGLAISAVSLLELVNLIVANRVDVIGGVEQTLANFTHDVDIRPLTLEIAARSAYLPSDFPRDPADRAIAATASVEGIPLVTADERILGCPSITTIW
jgi:PIN domain nuclease of toxin-antitoxin system